MFLDDYYETFDSITVEYFDCGGMDITTNDGYILESFALVDENTFEDEDGILWEYSDECTLVQIDHDSEIVLFE